MLKNYWQMTKPGIAFSVIMSAAAAFVLAQPLENFSYAKLAHLILGVGLSAMGGGVLNMVLEQDLDAKMRRTQNRPLPSGKIAPARAFFLGIILACWGPIHLAGYINLQASFLAAMSLMIYLAIYTPMKTQSSWSMAVGAVSGALPPMIGWAAATGRIEVMSWVLFGILFFWQWPHFLSLAAMYRDDYKRADMRFPYVTQNQDRQAAGLAELAAWAKLGFFLVFTILVGHWNLYAFIGAFLICAALIYISHGWKLSPNVTRAKTLFAASLFDLPLLTLCLLAFHP